MPIAQGDVHTASIQPQVSFEEILIETRNAIKQQSSSSTANILILLKFELFDVTNSNFGTF